MKSNAVAFIEPYMPAEVKLSRVRVIFDLAHFALSGLREPSLVKTFEDGLRAALFNRLSWSDNAQKTLSPRHPSTAQAVAEALRAAMLSNMVESIFAPQLLSNDLLLSEIGALIDLSPHDYSQDYPASLQGAYACAKDSLQITETCLVVLTALRELTKPIPKKDYHLPGYDEARKLLLETKNTFMRNVLLFGSLIGGETASEATKLITRRCLYNPGASMRFGVMQYLEHDGQYPSSWLTEDEENFRAEITRAYEKL